MHRRTRTAAALCSAAALAVLGACGTDDNGDGDGSGDGDVATGGDAGRVELSDTSLGEILVDGEGRTLYLFTPDSPGESTCIDECLDIWPPLEGDVEAGEGVNEELLGTIERDDGTVQATYGDWPLYYYAEDADAGDIEGQGVNDVWYVIDADGEAVQGEVEQDDQDSGY
ncbi:COG4315 family predicted lipoprotein [Phytoactinopolyspora halotolerans]|uniref:Lipoprotein n=1 Tax=Phytoactinopolyspora halotolerans TaxID=1981512 RepID=A0A6L9S0X8_9ACTN|nr:hypothetical protein [Phytoactinopolyspora halotolerans]NED98608.1 hypothetical protein [Phytoactinopolyspora halotolerans]